MTERDIFDQLRDIQAEFRAGADSFDQAYYERFGHPQTSQVPCRSLERLRLERGNGSPVLRP